MCSILRLYYINCQKDDCILVSCLLTRAVNQEPDIDLDTVTQNVTPFTLWRCLHVSHRL